MDPNLATTAHYLLPAVVIIGERLLLLGRDSDTLVLQKRLGAISKAYMGSRKMTK
jgi:hypothetical protein